MSKVKENLGVGTHELKVWPEYFEKLWSREKTFELRKNDRGFKVGDELYLREWSKNLGYSGSFIRFRVSYVLDEGFGLQPGWCVLGLREWTPAEDNK